MSIKYKLINEPQGFSATEQIMFNRGIPTSDFGNYIYTSDEDVNDYKLLNLHQLMRAETALAKALEQKKKICIIVDSDCDGFTSAALLINYLFQIDKEAVEERIDWLIHEGKQHGLADHIDNILTKDYGLVIVPDAGSNDLLEHKALAKNHIDCLILDHHDVDIENFDIESYEDAIIINNQLCDYPNKDLSGAGVVYQFCRYLDNKWSCCYADDFLDLVATGLDGDMMSLLSRETKHLIWKGFKSIDNIRNPFISGMVKKNDFSLNKAEYKSEYLVVSPMGAAFFIVPFINATMRSGTTEEKELVFEAMLTHKAFQKIPSNKRGHSIGEMETVLEQALRTVTNVKNRQTKAQDSGLMAIEKEIEENHLMEHKTLLFCEPSGIISPNVAGLVANKIMAKYQRPVCILIDCGEAYQGSARGCEKADVKDFKKYCLNYENTNYAVGHPGAFGLSIPKNKKEDFISYMDKNLPPMSNEPIYFVDYIFQGENFEKETILDIAKMNDFWGKDFDRSQIAIENLKLDLKKINVYQKKNITIKIQLNNDVAIMWFDVPEDILNKIETNSNLLSLNLVGECVKNEFMGTITPQIKIVDYELNYIF